MAQSMTNLGWGRWGNAQRNVPRHNDVAGTEGLYMAIHLYACIIGQLNMQFKVEIHGIKVCHFPAGRGIGALTV